jgi:sialate O-acetylesterase
MIPRSISGWVSISFLTAAWMGASLDARADVQLHSLFSDHMVLQRDMTVPVWGWADEGEKITVEFRGRRVSTRAKGGQWMVELGKQAAGGPDELRVMGKNTLTVHDVLVGEIWIASGQSNMEWPMSLAHEAGPDIRNANNGFLRLFTVPKLKAPKPVGNVASAWRLNAPDSVSNFSAVAYYFGNFLQQQLGVPVGIIHTSWGGSPAEVWVREGILSEDKEYKREILEAYPAQAKKYEESLAQFKKEEAEAKEQGKPFTKRAPGSPWRPSELYNGMIAPLVPYAIRGAIWYQGESNAGRAYQYRRLFPDMIRNWREDWDQGDFPFLLVQLAPFMAIKPEPAPSAWAELREAQSLATKILPNVGMAVITDLGDEKDIHPRRKKPVGYRLGLAALNIAYHQPVDYTGPVLHRAKFKRGQAVLRFENVGDGLYGHLFPEAAKANAITDQTSFTFLLEKGQFDAPLVGFSIAGPDQKFYRADAVIEGPDRVVVSSPEVSKPTAVRYGWADYPVANLYASTGPGADPLPASPFRTDDWPMTTAPKGKEK